MTDKRKCYHRNRFENAKDITNGLDTLEMACSS